VYPWIFTGGLDPYLWEPIPGVQTLDFKPYRVDLTPFAGVLSDGTQHTVAVSVYNADSYFLATANLLLFVDHGAKSVTGGILSNTLTQPTPVVQENIATSAGLTYTGTINVGSNRSFTISGYVNTSHGRVETTVNQTVDFLSKQEFDVSPTTEIQNARQTSTLDSKVTTIGGPLAGIVNKHFSYPLNLDYTFNVNPDGSYYQTVKSDQQDLVRVQDNPKGSTTTITDLSNRVIASDTLKWDASGNFLGPVDARTTQTYRLLEPRRGCYDRTITAENQKLVSVIDGLGCGN
jgi:hypothetical protein